MDWTMTQVIHFFASGLLNTSVDWIKGIMDMVSTSAKADLYNGGFIEWFQRVLGLSIPLIIVFLTFNVVGTALKMGGVPSLGPALKAGLVATIGAVLALPVIRVLNNLCEGLVKATAKLLNKDLDKLLQQVMLKNLAGGASVAEELSLILFAALFIVASLIIFLILMLRDAVLLVAVIVGPIALAGAAWGTTSQWPRKWVTTIVAVIFTKWAIFLVLALGISMLSWNAHKGIFENFIQFLQITIMLIAAMFAPWFTFMFFDFMGESTVNAIEGQAIRGLSRTKATAAKAGHSIKAAMPQPGGIKGKIAAKTKSSLGGQAAGGVGGAARKSAQAVKKMPKKSPVSRMGATGASAGGPRPNPNVPPAPHSGKPGDVFLPFTPPKQ